MGRHRSRSYSPRRRGRSRTPPNNHGKHYDDPRDRRRVDRRSPPPSGLLVRNIPLDTRPDELRIPFEKYGPVKDVYLPRDYYTGEPRGFGFVKFRYAEDAAKAKDRLNYTSIGGREIRIVYAEENRKTPREMRKPVHTSGRSEGRRRSPARSPRRKYNSCSRSPVTKKRDSRSVSHSPSPHIERDGSGSRHSPRDRSKRSQTPRDERDIRSKRSVSPRKDSPGDERQYKRKVRSPIPRDTAPRDGKQFKSSQRSHSPRKTSLHDEDYKSSRKSMRSRETSPQDEKDLRSPKRSVSPKREYPRVNDSPDERTNQTELRSTSPNDFKSHDDNSHKSSRRRAGPVMSSDDEDYHLSKDISVNNGNDLRSSERSVSPRKVSPPIDE